MRQNRRSSNSKKYLYGILLLLGCFVVVSIMKVFSVSLKGFSIREVMNYAESELQSEILDLYLPVLVSGAFDHEQTSKSASEVLISYLISRTPSLKYDQDVMNLETPTEDGSVYDAIHQNKLIMDELSSDLLLKENQTQKEQSIEYASDQSPLKISDNQISNNQINDHQTMGQFSPATPQISYSLEDLSDFTYLLSHFYTVDKTTSISQDVLSARKMLSKNYSIQREASSDAPQILIYHTHSLEAYADSNPNDISTGVVGVGAYLSALLKERGYQVLHHTKSYDKVSHDQAYSLAAPALEALLKEYPSIEIIIDIHRDGVANDRHLVTEINDKPTAQIMLFNGLSSTVAHGPIEYLPNTYIEDNLAFAFQIQLKCAEYHPTLARKIYLKGYRYNLHYRPRSLLLEVGAQTNSLEEAKNSMEPFADMLDKVLNP